MKSQSKKWKTMGQGIALEATNPSKMQHGGRVAGGMVRMMAGTDLVTDVNAEGKGAFQKTGERMIVEDDTGRTRRIEANGVSAKGGSHARGLHKNIEVEAHDTVTDHQNQSSPCPRNQERRNRMDLVTADTPLRAGAETQRMQRWKSLKNLSQVMTLTH
jgi:hypothetical protein